MRKYAYSVLEAYGIKGAISVCSRCLLRKEFFWRFKLSFLSQVDGLRFLRSRLKKFGYDGKGSVKTFTIHSFSEEIVGVIDSIYQDFTTESFRADAYRLFDTTEGIGTLAESGWEIANHTAGHYSIGAPSYMHMSEEQFDECESDLAKNLGIATRFWVVPFGYGVNAVEPAKGHKWMTEKDKIFVHVGNMANRNVDHENQLVYRIGVPQCSARELLRFLDRAVSVA